MIPVLIEQQTLVIHGVLFHVVVVVVKLNLQGASDQQSVRKRLPLTKQPSIKGGPAQALLATTVSGVMLSSVFGTL